MISMNKVVGRHSLLAFKLNPQQLQRGAIAASHEHIIAFDQQSAFGKTTLHWLCIPHLQALAAEAGERAGPGLEAAQSITNLFSGATKINAAVFFLKNWR